MSYCRGIIFDFDDTLVETTIFFEISRGRFARYMADLNFPTDEVLATLDRMDIDNVRRCGGFLKECFPNAMVRTYSHFCQINNIDPDPGICKKVEGIGWWVFDQKPIPVRGAREVLEELYGEFDLFLATKGDPSVQWKRIEESGFKKFFKKIYVLKDKTGKEYEDMARSNNLSGQHSWVVGNSIKSDINPGIMAGLNCIYIPNKYTWQFEMEDPAGDHVTLESLGEVPGFLLKKDIAV
ncbi:MAG: HAD family hydrolase [Bacillota bacterium]